MPDRSNSAVRVKALLGKQVGLMSFLWRWVITQSMSYAIGSYRRSPFVSVAAHAKKTMGVIRLRAALVLSVFNVHYFAQIAYLVVGAITVNVVNLIFWPFAMYMKPNKAMGQIPCTPNAGHDIPGQSFAGNHMTDANMLVHAHLPCESPALRVVLKYFAQALRGKIRGSHEALLLLIGQRPARVDSACGLRYFISSKTLSINVNWRSS